MKHVQVSHKLLEADQSPQGTCVHGQSWNHRWVQQDGLLWTSCVHCDNEQILVKNAVFEKMTYANDKLKNQNKAVYGDLEWRGWKNIYIGLAKTFVLIFTCDVTNKSETWVHWSGQSSFKSEIIEQWLEACEGTSHTDNWNWKVIWILSVIKNCWVISISNLFYSNISCGGGADFRCSIKWLLTKNFGLVFRHPIDFFQFTLVFFFPVKQGKFVFFLGNQIKTNMPTM